jgi:hypothetical protein
MKTMTGPISLKTLVLVSSPKKASQIGLRFGPSILPCVHWDCRALGRRCGSGYGLGRPSFISMNGQHEGASKTRPAPPCADRDFSGAAWCAREGLQVAWRTYCSPTGIEHTGIGPRMLRALPYREPAPAWRVHRWSLLRCGAARHARTPDGRSTLMSAPDRRVGRERALIDVSMETS